MAVINDDIESWRSYKKVQNLYNKKVRKAKLRYYNSKLNIYNLDENGHKEGISSSKKMWSMVKSLSP